MITSLYGALETGLIYAIMALGVYISFRILDFPDLTVDGSFVTGGGVAAISIIGGVDPIVATLLGFVAGFLVGCITGLLHTKGNINPLLAGIIMMIGLYSVNLRIMGQANLSLLNETTLFSQLEGIFESLSLDAVFFAPYEWLGLGAYTPRTFYAIVMMLLVVFVVKNCSISFYERKQD